MERRTLLMLAAILPLAAACKNGASSVVEAPKKTFADLAGHPGRPLSNRGLVAIALPPRADKPTTLFAVRCAACNSDHFDPRERLSLRSGGDTAPRGINLTCRGCQLRTVLFDAARDGYGGKLGHTAMLSEDRPVDRPLLDAAGEPLTDCAVRYACRYNLAPDEIFQMAEAEGVTPPELFDVFALEAAAGDAGWREVWDYTCA